MFLKDEVQLREFSKEKVFNMSTLNIKLPKFKGYNSELDIFSFQDEFEKLYSRDVPKKRLPDLLEKNHLDTTPLSLVKDQDDIAEIWGRLQKAYGDSRIMLKNKLTSVRNIGPLSMLKDSNRLREGLISLTNAMSDLLKLSKKFNIEEKLCHGEGFDIIYRMMGDVRITRWLNGTCDENLDERKKWERLQKFLGRELKIEEEKALIKDLDASNESREKEKEHKDSRKGSVSSRRDRYVSDYVYNEKCCFCDETDHVLTNGPKRSKIMQYFACKKSVSMTPTKRFKELCLMGYCFQCLLPGAKKNEGRHVNGSCQSDYICKHSSHENYQQKKHVLVCHEHCEQDENMKLLNEYKSKFILPLKYLEDFFQKTSSCRSCHVDQFLRLPMLPRRS